MRRTLVLLTGLSVLGLAIALTAQSLPGSEQPAPPAGDAEVVAGPIPEKITSSSAVVWWETTAPAESILVYGTAPTDQSYRVQRPWHTTTHEVSVKKLQPGTTYYLAVLQRDGTKSASGQFTTEPSGYSADSSVRITNGPLFEQITPDSATITWSANLPASFVLHYGTDTQKLDATAKAPWTPTTHRVVLEGLRSDMHYYFTVEPNQQLTDADQPAQDSDEQAATPSPPTPQIYAFRTLARGQQALNIGPRH